MIRSKTIAVFEMHVYNYGVSDVESFSEYLVYQHMLVMLV